MRRLFLFPAVPVIRPFGNHPQLQYQSLFELFALLNAYIQCFGTRTENNGHHRLGLRFREGSRHMVFDFEIVGKFRNKMLNFARHGGTKRGRCPRPFAQ
ncbi:hypothetical protein D3C72_959540 [compost metagenome]